MPGPGPALFQLPQQPGASWLAGCGWNLHFHQAGPRQRGVMETLSARQPSSLSLSKPA